MKDVNGMLVSTRKLILAAKPMIKYIAEEARTKEKEVNESDSKTFKDIADQLEQSLKALSTMETRC